MQVHLPMQNNVIFRDDDDLQNIVGREQKRKTTLTEWFTCNQMENDANELLYGDFPCKWVWNKCTKKWSRRKLGNSISQMYNISPSASEQYFMFMLRNVCKDRSIDDMHF